MTNQTEARIDGVRTVGIPVNDQDRALQFYVETLGFEKLMDAPLEQFGGRWIEVSPPRSTTTIALTPARESAPAGIDTGIRFTTQDAAALHAQLTGRGVPVDELLHWEGVPPIVVADARPRRLGDPRLRGLRSTDLRQGRRDPSALPGLTGSPPGGDYAHN